MTECEYYGFSLSAGNLGGDTFINFLILGAVEFPAYFLSMWLLRKFGRRNPYIFIMLLGAAASLAGTLTLGDDETVTRIRITLAMVGKFSVTAALGMLYVYSGEVFPTVSLVSCVIISFELFGSGAEERGTGILLHDGQDWLLALCFHQRSGEIAMSDSFYLL